MFSQPDSLKIELPAWAGDFAASCSANKNIGERMDFVIAASRRNVEEQTGGPFAAAVFESESGKLVSLGMNLVVTQGLSVLHAEIVALSLAQRKLNSFDLGGEGMPLHELFISAEPCAMCLGAIPWSGVTRVVTAARDEDVRRIGFDEGAKPRNWQESLSGRGIEVVGNVKRDEAVAVLEMYKDSGGTIY